MYSYTEIPSNFRKSGIGPKDDFRITSQLDLTANNLLLHSYKVFKKQDTLLQRTGLSPTTKALQDPNLKVID